MITKYSQLIIGLLFGLILGFGIGNYNAKSKSESNIENASYQNNYNSKPTSSNQRSNASSKPSNAEIPQKAYDVWNYVKEHHEAINGYVGGREFKNREKLLEQKNALGETMRYQEWDVNPKSENHNRGTERLITSQDERAWYTNDHYKSFKELN